MLINILGYAVNYSSLWLIAHNRCCQPPAPHNCSAGVDLLFCMALLCFLLFGCRCRVLTVFMAAIVAIDAVDDILVVLDVVDFVGGCTYCCSCCCCCCSCGGSGGGDDGDTKSKIWKKFCMIEHIRIRCCFFFFLFFSIFLFVWWHTRK